MPDNKLKREVFLQLANNYGFALSGICKSKISDVSKNAFNEWLSKGYAGEMAWINNRKEERLNPQLYMKDVKTVLVVARFYPNKIAGDGINISSYVRGDDYHDTIKEDLQKLANILSQESQNQFQYRACVDTSPVLEREFARLAGIGWQGKNAMIINQKLGSYFFIGEILTNQEADIYDEPVDDRCGTCTRCLDACPPKAIIEPYVIQSTLCTSYQTIEKKGAIEENTNWQNWLYGCDICQQVCPWNKSEPTHQLPLLFDDNHPIDEINLTQVLLLTDDSFKLKFKNSAIKRIKRSGLIRNALYLWKNDPTLADIEIVKNLCMDSDLLIQNEAKNAIAFVNQNR